MTIKKIFKRYIQTSIHVAVAVCCLSMAAFLEFDFPFHKGVLGFTFLGSILGYNFVKFSSTNNSSKPPKVIQYVSTLSFLGMGYFLLHIPVTVLLVASIFGLLTICYALPLFSNKNLRSWAGLKIFVVGLVWAGVTVLFPWFTTANGMNPDVWLLFFQYFLWVVVLTIPFDIRDMIIDSKSLYTLPQLLGIKRVKILGFVLLLVVLVLEGFKDIIQITHFCALTVGVIITMALLGVSKKNQKEFFASFWVESIPIWYFLVYLLLDSYCPNC